MFKNYFCNNCLLYAPRRGTVCTKIAEVIFCILLKRLLAPPKKKSNNPFQRSVRLRFFLYLCNVCRWGSLFVLRHWDKWIFRHDKVPGQFVVECGVLECITSRCVAEWSKIEIIALLPSGGSLLERVWRKIELNLWVETHWLILYALY